MTTRRSRLQVRPNIGRGPKDMGGDVSPKKTSAVTAKCPLKKETKENANVNRRLEGNNVTDQLIGEPLCDKTLPEYFSKHREFTETDETLDRGEKPNVANSNHINACARKSTVESESFNTLINTNKECIVVLDRTIVDTNKHVEVESSSGGISSEYCLAKSTTEKPISEKNKKCLDRQQVSHTEQDIHGIGQKEKTLNSSSTKKESSAAKLKENLSHIDSSTDSSSALQSFTEDGISAKPLGHSSTASPEKKTSNRACSNEETSKRRNRFSKKPPERGTMTMMDLIFWNPPNNPMGNEKDDSTNEADISILETMEEDEVVSSTPNLQDKLPAVESSLQDETEELPGPRVMVGPDGDITIDEDSLVIRRSDPEQNASKELVHEVAKCTYNSFRKPSPKHYWTNKETARFYKALSVVGTDFSLMLNLFPKRNRQELKNKFKREEKLNRHLVDRAIKDPQQFDLTAFDDDDETSEEETRNGMKRAKFRITRKKYKKRKLVKDTGSSEDDVVSDEDVLVTEPVNKPNESDGVRKSGRKRKETSKEIPIYSTKQTVKRKQSKPRVPRQKKKVESRPMECDYDSLEIIEIPNENVEVVSEDHSIIVCPSSLTTEVATSDNSSTLEALVDGETTQNEIINVNIRDSVQDTSTQVGAKENEQDLNLLHNSDELEQNAVDAIHLDKPLQQQNTRTPTSSPSINSEQTNFPPGQLLLVAGKTNNNEQIVHVYVVSQSPCAQESLLTEQQQ